MGERRNGVCRVEFDRELRVNFHGVKATRDAGLLACCELEDAFGLPDMIGSQLCHTRTAKNTQHPMTALARPVKPWSLTALRGKLLRIGAQIGMLLFDSVGQFLLAFEAGETLQSGSDGLASGAAKEPDGTSIMQGVTPATARRMHGSQCKGLLRPHTEGRRGEGACASLISYGLLPR